MSGPPTQLSGDVHSVRAVDGAHLEYDLPAHSVAGDQSPSSQREMCVWK